MDNSLLEICVSQSTSDCNSIYSLSACINFSSLLPAGKQSLSISQWAVRERLAAAAVATIQYGPPGNECPLRDFMNWTIQPPNLSAFLATSCCIRYTHSSDIATHVIGGWHSNNPFCRAFSFRVLQSWYIKDSSSDISKQSDTRKRSLRHSGRPPALSCVICWISN